MAGKSSGDAAKNKDLLEALVADVPRVGPAIEVEFPIIPILVLPGGKRVPWKEPAKIEPPK